VKNSRCSFSILLTRPFGWWSQPWHRYRRVAWGSGYRLMEVTRIQTVGAVHGWPSFPPHFPFCQVSSVNLDEREDFRAHLFAWNRNRKNGLTIQFHVWIGTAMLWRLKVELTSTLRTGFHRYTFQNRATQQVMLRLGGPLGPSDIIDGSWFKSSKYASGLIWSMALTIRKSAKQYTHLLQSNSIGRPSLPSKKGGRAKLASAPDLTRFKGKGR